MVLNTNQPIIKITLLISIKVNWAIDADSIALNGGLTDWPWRDKKSHPFSISNYTLNQHCLCLLSSQLRDDWVVCGGVPCKAAAASVAQQLQTLAWHFLIRCKCKFWLMAKCSGYVRMNTKSLQIFFSSSLHAWFVQKSQLDTLIFFGMSKIGFCSSAHAI